MPRPLRVQMEGALYYVTCRAELGIPLFQDSRDTETYLELLSQYKNQNGFRVYAFTLCAYELHLLLETGGGVTISQFMHALNSRYTKLYCSRYVHKGHLFQGRFRSVVAEKETTLLPLIRFTHGQPKPLASSLSRYEGKETLESWVDLLEAKPESWRMEAGSAEREELRGLLQRPAIGSDSFLAEVKNRMAVKAAGPEEEDLKELEEGEEERELVPIRIRKGWKRGGFLAAVAVAGLAGVISQRVPAARTPSLDNVITAVIVGSESAPAEAPVAAASVASGGQLASFIPVPHLGGTAWDLQVRSMRGPGQAPIQKDSIRFDGNRMTSAELSAEGFSSSNCTLTPQPDGTFLWETMQSGPAGETVCWRGECDGRKMRGVMTRQKDGKEAESFNFIAVNPMSET